MKDWQHTILGKHIDLLTGHPFKSEAYTDGTGGIRLLRGDNVCQGFIRWEDVKKWSPNETNGLDRFWLKENDVVIAMDRTWVKAGLKCSRIKEHDTPSLLVQRVARLRGANGLSSSFLAHLVQSHRFSQYVKGVQTETAVPHISPQQIREYPIYLPSVSEQEKISDTLSCWDHAINLTERLSVAKQERRTWLMQQLLTGKQRLPGFDVEWRKVHLGDVFTNRVESNSPDLPLVAITGSGGVVSREDLVRRDTSSEDKSKYLRICPGDIGYNTMRMWQGVCGLSQLEGIVSPAYTIVTPKADIDGEFMALLFKSLPVIHLFHRHSQGLVDDTLNLKWRHFSEIKVTVPEKFEQQTIAAVFRKADREIDLIRAQLDALREQKKGLMQHLLTGKVKVKI